MWLDHVPDQMRDKGKECGFNDPPHWRNDKFMANKNVMETRSLADFVYDESFSLGSELVGPLPTRTSATLLHHMLHNKRGGVLALITAPPFVYEGYAPLCTTVPRLLATSGVGRAALLKTPVYQGLKLHPVPLWDVLWGEAPPTSETASSPSRAPGDIDHAASVKRAKVDDPLQ